METKLIDTFHDEYQDVMNPKWCIANQPHLDQRVVTP